MKRLMICRATMDYAYEILIEARSAIQDGGPAARRSAAVLESLAADAELIAQHSSGTLSHSKDPADELAEGEKLRLALANSSMHQARFLKYRGQSYNVYAHDALACLINAVRAIHQASVNGLGILVEVED